MSGMAGVWSKVSVARCHRTLHTTPESLGETQPLANEDHSLDLALWNARSWNLRQAPDGSNTGTATAVNPLAAPGAG